MSDSQINPQTAAEYMRRALAAEADRDALKASNATLIEALEVAATAELYDPATGIIDANVLETVQDAARIAIAKTTQ